MDTETAFSRIYRDQKRKNILQNISLFDPMRKGERGCTQTQPGSNERNAIQAHKYTVDLLRASFISVLIRSTSVKPAISRRALSIKLTDINGNQRESTMRL